MPRFRHPVTWLVIACLALLIAVPVGLADSKPQGVNVSDSIRAAVNSPSVASNTATFREEGGQRFVTIDASQLNGATPVVNGGIFKELDLDYIDIMVGVTEESATPPTAPVAPLALTNWHEDWYVYLELSEEYTTDEVGPPAIGCHNASDRHVKASCSLETNGELSVTANSLLTVEKLLSIGIAATGKYGQKVTATVHELEPHVLYKLTPMAQVRHKTWVEMQDHFECTTTFFWSKECATPKVLVHTHREDNASGSKVVTFYGRLTAEELP